MPDGCSDLLCIDGADWWLCGPERRWWEFELPAGSTAVGVRFRPGVLRTLFGVDVATMLERRVRPSDLMCVERFERHRVAMRDAGGPAGRVAVVERLVADTARGRQRDPLVGAAVDAVVDDAWSSVGELAMRLGIGTRALHRRATQHLGYGLATFARIVRFQRFAAHASVWPKGGSLIASLAAAAGYSDQAHLARDCLAITGLTPRRFLDAYVPTFPDMADPYKTGRPFVTTVGA